MHIRWFVCVWSVIVLFGAPAALAGWIAKADFSSCPRQYIPSTHGEEGPFASESDCNARLRQVQSQTPLACARYTCSDSGGASTAGAAPPSLNQGISDALAAGMTGKISAADATGLVSLGLLGTLLTTPSRPKTAEEIRAEQAAAERARAAAIVRQQERDQLKREKETHLDQQAYSQLALLDDPGATGAAKAKVADSEPSRKCRDDRPGPDQAGATDFVCHVTVCGGEYNGSSVCCPTGYPKLNECDCRCYANDSTFDCARYAACNYSANFNPGTVPANEVKK